MTRFLILSLLSLVATGCNLNKQVVITSNSNSINVNGTNPSNISNPSHIFNAPNANLQSSLDYSYTIPKNWKMEDPRAVPSIAADDSFVHAPAKEGFAANVTVIKTKIEAGETLEGDLSKAIAQLSKSGSNVSKIEHRYTQIDRSRAILIMDTLQYGQYALHMSQIHTIRNGFVYTITMGALHSNYKDYNSAFNTILSSFKWKS